MIHLIVQFNLPNEKAQFLTREDNLNIFSASMQWIPISAQVEDKIVECFHHGGGYRIHRIIDFMKL